MSGKHAAICLFHMIVVSILSFALAGCAGNSKDIHSLYSVDYDEFLYDYIVYDREGNVLLSDESKTREPHIEVLSDDVLKLSVQAGTGLSTRWTVYCNVEEGARSEIFYSVLGECDDKVVYVNYTDGNHSLVAQDMFDKTVFYCEIPLENVSPVADPVVDFRVAGDGTATITYLTGEAYTETVMDIGVYLE